MNAFQLTQLIYKKALPFFFEPTRLLQLISYRCVKSEGVLISSEDRLVLNNVRQSKGGARKMAEYFGKLGVKTLYFVATFFALYMFSFYFGLRIVDSFNINETALVIRFFAFAAVIASIQSFIGTVGIHVLYRFVGKARNFAAWFRTVNLVFLYGSGLVTAIATMKGFLNYTASNSIL